MQRLPYLLSALDRERDFLLTIRDVPGGMPSHRLSGLEFQCHSSPINSLDVEPIAAEHPDGL